MNTYRWALLIIASAIGIGNIWLLDFSDLSFSNNIFEYIGIVAMFCITCSLAFNSPDKKPNKKSIS